MTGKCLFGTLVQKNPFSFCLRLERSHGVGYAPLSKIHGPAPVNSRPPTLFDNQADRVRIRKAAGGLTPPPPPGLGPRCRLCSIGPKAGPLGPLPKSCICPASMLGAGLGLYQIRQFAENVHVCDIFNKSTNLRPICAFHIPHPGADPGGGGKGPPPPPKKTLTNMNLCG